MKRFLSWTFAVSLTACCLAPASALIAADAANTAKIKQLAPEFEKAEQEFEANVRYPRNVIFDPKYMKQMTKVAKPGIEKQDALLRELVDAGAKSEFALSKLALNEAELVYFKDAEAGKRLDDLASSFNLVDSTTGKLGKSFADWLNAMDSESEQLKILDDVGTLAKAQPANGTIARVVAMMIDYNAASLPVMQKINETIKPMKGTFAASYNDKPLKLGAPFVVTGKTLKGSPFSTDSLKGKVIMIDFWATWCPPCREEIPKVAELYSKYHAQGFEIVAVDSDSDMRELGTFLQQHPEMQWPELVAPGVRGWHPLTKKYGVNSIPRMFLIDRNGILRTTEARSTMEKDVPSLLAEASIPDTPKSKSVSKPIVH